MTKSCSSSFLKLFVSFAIISSIILCLILFALLIFNSGGGADAAAASKIRADPPPFRCFRPFSQLRSFTAKDMTRGDNCEFAPFMRVVNASARIQCYSNNNNNNNNNSKDNHQHPADPTGQGRDGCYVTLSLIGHKFHPDASVASGPNQFDQFLRERSEQNLHLDAMRYTMELKAVDGQSTVRYKGFGKEGYSVCCSMIVNSEKNKKNNNLINSLEGYVVSADERQQNEESDDQEEICEWVEVKNENVANNNNEEHENSENNNNKGKVQKEQRIKSATACPLNDPAFDPEISFGGSNSKGMNFNYQGKEIRAEVTRPLHGQYSGKWEARIEFYRDHVYEGIGRVVIPFEVTERDIAVVNAVKKFSGESQNQEGEQKESNSAVVVAKKNEDEK
jgi:hypothetical protein